MLLIRLHCVAVVLSHMDARIIRPNHIMHDFERIIINIQLYGINMRTGNALVLYAFSASEAHNTVYYTLAVRGTGRRIIFGGHMDRLVT